MFVKFQTISKIILFVGLVFACLFFVNCGDDKKDDSSEGSSIFSDDTDRAVELVQEANRNLKSIKALYDENNPKVEELKTALNKKDVVKVKEIAEGLSLVIIDGYAFAENAKEKLDKAKELEGINDQFKQYLELKSESLDLQIKAFNYRRETAKLFRDEFGTEDTSKLDAAKTQFIENEKKFADLISQAKDRNDQADKMWTESKRKK